MNEMKLQATSGSIKSSRANDVGGGTQGAQERMLEF